MGADEAESTALVRRIYERWGNGDIAGAVAFFAPDIQVTTIDRETMSPKYLNNREDVHQLLDELDGATGGTQIDLEEVVAHGDQVSVTVCQTFRPPGAESPTSVTVGHLWTLQDGQVVRFRFYPDPMRAHAEAQKASEG